MSDDQHALALQREPVRVQQVRGPMQRDDGLARTGSALHDKDAGERAADDLVLLPLDRGDDVGEVTRARRLE